ncbi:MAG: S-layer protein [Candidatus Aenigmatarchaeota archaeon]
MQIRKFVASSLAALMAGATFAGAALAAVNVGGVLSHLGQQAATGTPYLVVVGDNAAASDIVGAIDVASALAQQVTKEVALPGVYTETVTGGISLDTEYVKLDFLNGQINKVIKVVTADDLPTILEKGIVEDEEGKEYKYEQMITLQGGLLKYNIDGEDKVPSLHYDFSDENNKNIVATYTLTFEEALDLSTVVGKELRMMGQSFIISPDSTPSKIILYRAAQELLVNAGEEQSVRIGGRDYVIRVVGINTQGQTPSAVINVNGVSRTVYSGNSYTISGLRVYVKDIQAYTIPTSAGAVVLLVGAEEVTLEDNGQVKIGTTTVENANVKIETSNDLVSKISIDLPIKDGRLKLGSTWTDPVFGELKLTFDKVLPTVYDEIKLTPSSDEKKYSITLTTSEGIRKTFEFAAGSGSNVELKLGGKTLITKLDECGGSGTSEEITGISQSDYVLMNLFGKPRLYRVDVVSNSNVKMTDYFTGEVIEVSLQQVQTDVYKGTKVIRGNTVDFIVEETSVNGSKKLLLTIQWDENIDVSNVNIADFVTSNEGSTYYVVKDTTPTCYPAIKTKEGHYLAIYSDSAQVNVVLGEFDKSQSNVADTYTITITSSGDKLAFNGLPFLLVSHQEEEVSSGYTDFGTFVYLKGGKTLTLRVPTSQAYPKVYLGGKDLRVVSAATEAGTYKTYAPLSLPVAKLAREVTTADKTNANIVLVGGPCANSLVQELINAGKMDSSFTCYPTLGAAWTPGAAYVQVIEDAFATGRVALVVAGTNAEDTRLATSLLSQGKLEGQTASKVKVTGTVAAPVITPM